MLEALRQDVLGEGACIRTPFGVRRITYADHVASGRALRSVETALRDAVLPLYANTHTEDSATGAHTTRVMHDASEYVKRCLGAGPDHKIVFPGTGATGATGAVKRLQEILGVAVPAEQRARLLDVLPTRERLVVFVGPYEHHSNEVSWRESLAEVVTVPLDEHGLLDLAALEQALADPRFEGRPKLGSFSAASNVTGLLTDVRAIARTLHRHGAWAAFDYAACAPYLRVDVSPSEPGGDDGIDVVMLSPHKFLGGPGAAGVLLFHRALYRLAAPSTAGGGTVTFVSPTTHRFLRDIELREDAGTPGILQKMRAAMAFRVKERVGVGRIEGIERDYATRAVQRLRATPGVEILGNVDAPRLAVVSFLIRDGERYLHPRFVVRLLSDLFGIQGRAGCSCAGPYGHTLLHIDAAASEAYLHAIEAGYEGVRPGWSRVNLHWLIDEAEFSFLLDAIAFVAQHGAAFVPLYRFDWRTGAWRHQSEATDTADHAPAGEAPAGGAQRAEAAFDFERWRAVEHDTEPRAAAFRRYLEEARELEVAGTPMAGRDRADDVPAAVDARLVFFAR
jgi:selenocysteine lyase/cysteine desulfurase